MIKLWVNSLKFQFDAATLMFIWDLAAIFVCQIVRMLSLNVRNFWPWEPKKPESLKTHIQGWYNNDQSKEDGFYFDDVNILRLEVYLVSFNLFICLRNVIL